MTFKTVLAKTVLTGLPLIALVVPAAAQTSYFIVQDSATKHCSIVDERPVTRETTVVGPNGVVYKTRTEAEDAMRTVTVCRP